MPSRRPTPEPAWYRPAAIGLVLLLLAALFFTRLGHYALWDDEAITALNGKGVLRTGWPSVLMDHGNVVAYRNGVIVNQFYDPVDPPLEDYLVAASFALFGQNPWAGRLPFAIAGFLAAALVVWWVRRADWTVFLVTIIGLLCNVSLFLYCRQCRYYALSVLFATAIVYVYWHWKLSARTLLVLSGLSVLLFAASCFLFIPVYACLAVDYLVWKRHEWPPTFRNALLLFGPQAVVSGIVGFFFNPWRAQYGGYEALNGFGDRMTLVYWFWRDGNVCEYYSFPLLALALVLGVMRKQAWLVRGCVALALFITLVALVTPQPVAMTSVADVRYFSVVVLLAMSVQAGAICALLGRSTVWAVAAALLVFGSNLFSGGPLLAQGFRSTICAYVGELAQPVPEPYTPAADWINANVPEGKSVWVMPEYSTYPLMFRAPKALYAWQLDWPPRPDFAKLPPIHFKGQVAPDYLVGFGPFTGQMVQELQKWNQPGLRYALAATLPFFWHDVYRPELFWRSFTPITGYDPNAQAIYIFKRTSP